MSNQELHHRPVQTHDPSYDQGQEAKEQTAASPHLLTQSLDLVHPSSLLYEKNRLIMKGVHLV